MFLIIFKGFLLLPLELYGIMLLFLITSIYNLCQLMKKSLTKYRLVIGGDQFTQ